jgi:phage-related protein
MSLVVDIVGNVDGLNKALGDATGTVKKFGSAMGVSIPKTPMDAAVKGIKAVSKVTKTVVTDAKDAAAAEAQFALALGNAGIDATAHAASLDAAIASSQKLAFTDDEARDALQSLATATGDANASIDLLSASQDIARLAGVDLATASDAVAKAYTGTDTALTRMIPGLEAGATGMDTIAAASALAQGQADEFSKSSEAMGKKASIAFSEASEAIGAALLPALQGLGEALGPLIVAFAKLVTSLLPALMPLIETLARVAEIAAKAITKIVDAVTRLIGKIRELLGPLKEAVEGLKNLDLNPFNGKSAPAPVTASPGVSTLQSGGGSSKGGGVVINIYGDPSVIEARVTKALRDYSRRNGIGSVFTPGRT